MSPESLEKIEQILVGIDKDDFEFAGGWWETSTGAEFGAKIKSEIIDFINKESIRARINQMHVEQDAYSKTLDLFRLRHASINLPSGLTLGFQKRMNDLIKDLEK